MFFRTFFTSSSLNGFTTATTSFIVDSSDPLGSRALPEHVNDRAGRPAPPPSDLVRRPGPVPPGALSRGVQAIGPKGATPGER